MKTGRHQGQSDQGLPVERGGRSLQTTFRDGHGHSSTDKNGTECCDESAPEVACSNHIADNERSEDQR